MKTSIEIEFKTKIDEKTYLKMLELFQLKDKIFKQTNYYFDTRKHDLFNEHITLRIRQKGPNYKLTSKTNQEVGIEENHIYLNQNEALDMLENGFDAQMININHYVYKVAELTTNRSKCAYLDGILFFDKNEYYDITDYEIEYEVIDYEKGKIVFEEFLKAHDIPYVKTISKSQRAYKNASH